MRFLVPLTVLSAAALAAVGGWAWQRTGASQSPAGSSRAVAGSPPAASSTGRALPIEVYQVQEESFELTVPSTGSLLARESVELVSELSRRLVRVRAQEGAKVRRGQILFELDTADLRAELKRLDVQIRLAKTNAERQKALLAEGLTTRQQFDIGEAELSGLEAERGVLGVTLAKATIRAPFAGTLGLRQVSEGAWLTPSTVLASLHDTSSLKLDFTVPERYAASLTPGQEFRFQVAGRAEPLKAKILAFEPSVEAASRSIRVRGVLENAPEDLLPGAFATVELPVRVEQAVLIPSIAVIPGADGRRVFVAREGLAHSVRVELGARTTDRVQVLSGLSPGDSVAVSNLLRIRDGARVAPRARKSAEPRAPASAR